MVDYELLLLSAFVKTFQLFYFYTHLILDFITSMFIQYNKKRHVFVF